MNDFYATVQEICERHIKSYYAKSNTMIGIDRAIAIQQKNAIIDLLEDIDKEYHLREPIKQDHRYAFQCYIIWEYADSEQTIVAESPDEAVTKYLSDNDMLIRANGKTVKVAYIGNIKEPSYFVVIDFKIKPRIIM